MEDDLLQSFALKTLVESSSYSVSGAAVTGGQAIEMALELKPDLILMDIVLDGDLNGIQAAIEIQQSLDVQIIFVTGIFNVESMGNLQHIKFLDIIPKPIQKDLLATSLSKCKKRRIA